MFVTLDIVDAKSDEKSVKLLIDTGSILCIVENQKDPSTCMIKFRYDDLPAGLVKGTFEEISALISPKKGQKQVS